MAHTEIKVSIPISRSLIKYHENPQIPLDRLFKLFDGSSRAQSEHISRGFAHQKGLRTLKLDDSSSPKWNLEMYFVDAAVA